MFVSVYGKAALTMLITRLELENIKSYKHITVDFQPGATAISGSNGAGKTTLVEAIGFALFDSMPYKQDQFVREGEKYGRVVVHLVANDDRPYEIERRCGTNALWTLYDVEANLRLEQRADVQDKLHELFGIERERSLESLFRDALGVPQGTFTSIFLQTPRTRKQTFDSLLQIEDYRTAADYLLEAQKQYKEQLASQELEIQRLTFETRDLDNWRSTLKEARMDDQKLKERNVVSTRRLTNQKHRYEQLKERKDQLQQCESRREQKRILRETAREQLGQAEQMLNEAQTASRVVEESREDYGRYCQAGEVLLQLRKDERERALLLKNQATLNSGLSTTRANIDNIQERLRETERAHKLILELLPQVERQSELDVQVGTLKLEAQSYETLRKEGNRLYKLREKVQQEQAATRQRIAQIEPLRQLSDQLQERVEQLTRLKAQSDQRTSKKLQLEEKQQALQDKKNELIQTATKLRGAEEAIKKIEAHRQEGEEYSLLQVRRQELERQLHHLRGNIESYTDSRARSAGGQCPLLHQTCLNIQQQGQLSLEVYFDGLLAEEQVQLTEISLQIAQIEERSAATRKYAESLEKLGRYVDQQENSAEHAERLNIEIRRQEREVQSLLEEWSGLQQIDQEIALAQEQLAASQKADQQTRQLPGLHGQVEQYQAQIEQYTSEFEERKSEAEPLKQSKEQLSEREQELKALDDPRTKSKAAQVTVKLESTYREQLLNAQETLQATIRQMDELEIRLRIYEQLDRSIGEQEATQKQTVAGYHLYLQNKKLAESLSERQRVFKEVRRKKEQAELDLAGAEAACQEAASAFDEQEFQAVEKEVDSLGQEVTRLASEMQALQARINEYEGRISRAELLLVELEAVQTEKKTLEDLSTMMEQFRKVIKDAAPHVLHAMLSDISAEANRIFGEIMGDRSAQLDWTDDYEINLVRQGVRRSFAQLSGGEQMSAALAVRLALLKKLSTINLAFFDEPTQNMDEQRRVNLAGQIQRVRGFDQLIVISHDDTFEQGLDSLIRLRKQDGQTRQLAEDEDPAAPTFSSEQVNTYAS